MGAFIVLQGLFLFGNSDCHGEGWDYKAQIAQELWGLVIYIEHSRDGVALRCSLFMYGVIVGDCHFQGGEFDFTNRDFVGGELQLETVKLLFEREGLTFILMEAMGTEGWVFNLYELADGRSQGTRFSSIIKQ